MVILTELAGKDSSSSSVTISDYRYDVFLSFRGTDTRYNFTDHLHKALVDAGLEIFLDDEEIQTGEDLKPELERAIEASRASIIIMSKNYASSTWCLDELVMILEQKRTSKHIVLPVFYHVEPTDVRKQRNSFGEALAKHQQMIEGENDVEKRNQREDKMDRWKQALTQVANLKGKDANGRRETMLIEEIVKEMGSMLDLHLRSKIPHLIGRHSSIETITSWLKDGSSHTSDIFTIWGMGGVGKTFLAKYIFKLHHHKFERSSFLEDVGRRCTPQSNGILDLQKQLLKDIQKQHSVDVCHVDVCTAMIEKALLRQPLLLVLDDIDSIEQLDMLLGTEGFHPRSKIIITTKDGSITEKCGLFRKTVPPKHRKHSVNRLNETESLQLLYFHSLRQNDPKEGYEEVARKLLNYCGGHPLALTVLGSSLCNEDRAAWEDALEMLENKIPPGIIEVIRISFDTLPSKNDKELFKHIACFFVGKDRDLTETVLKECGICTKSGIARLVDRCLLTFGPNNQLEMHQLLQEMGRDIVCQESPKKPWKRSRLWCHEDSFNVLKEERGTRKVQGLALEMKMLHGSSSATNQMLGDDLHHNFRTLPLPNRVHKFFSMIFWLLGWIFQLFSTFHRKKCDLRTEAFIKMDKLTLLQLNFVQLIGPYKNFPKGLRWLCMHGFHLKYIPSDLPVENLVALDMSYSNLEKLWKNPKCLGSLKILNLSYCDKLVRIIDFSGLPILERLILNGCVRLIEVGESIEQCGGLVFLDLSDCRKLKTLPRSIVKLKKVRILSIGGCVALEEFPIEMKDMDSLEVMRANNMCINSIKTFSVGMEVIPRSQMSSSLFLPSSLVELWLHESNLTNESFPKDLSCLSMLKKLYLGDNPIDSLPNCVRTLNKLELLSLNRCNLMESVLCPPSTIKRLETIDCFLLEKITFHPEILTPPRVHYELSVSLTEIQGIIKIQPIGDVNEEILCSIGWTDLENLKNQRLHIWDSYMWQRAKKLPIQMYYEFGIFSTCYPGNEVPHWFTHVSQGSSISFIMPSSPKNCKSRGLNVSFVHTFSGIGKVSFSRTKISNMTKNRSWIYYAYILSVQEDEESIVWLSHWMFGNNEFEDGDEVSVTIVEEKEDAGAEVRKCGVSVVDDIRNKEQERETDPLDYYKSWKHRIGGDLSAFELTTGDYFLIHDRFFWRDGEAGVLFQHKTTQNLVGNATRYKGAMVELH